MPGGEGEVATMTMTSCNNADLRRQLEEVFGAKFDEFDPSVSRGFGVVPMPITPIIEAKQPFMERTERTHEKHRHIKEELVERPNSQLSESASIVEGPITTPKIKIKLPKHKIKDEPAEDSEKESHKRLKLEEVSNSKTAKGQNSFQGSENTSSGDFVVPSNQSKEKSNSEKSSSYRSMLNSLFQRFIGLPPLIPPLRPYNHQQPCSQPPPSSQNAFRPPLAKNFVKAEEEKSMSMCNVETKTLPTNKVAIAQKLSPAVEAKQNVENEPLPPTVERQLSLDLKKLAPGLQNKLLKKWEEKRQDGSTPLSAINKNGSLTNTSSDTMPTQKNLKAPKKECPSSSPALNQQQKPPVSVKNADVVESGKPYHFPSPFDAIKPFTELPQATPPTRTPSSVKRLEKHDGHHQKSTFLERSKPCAKASLDPYDFEKPTAEYYHNQAKSLKRRAADETDRFRQALLLFEAMVYYIAGAEYTEGEAQYSSISEAQNFLTHFFNEYKQKSKGENYFRWRLKALERLVSACLAYRLYTIRNSQSFKNYEELSRFERENAKILGTGAGRNVEYGSTGSVNSGGTTTCSNMTPSPASSTPSGSQETTVTLPVHIYLIQSQQIRTFNQILWALRMWEEAMQMMNLPENKEFFPELADLCGGKMEFHSPLKKLAEFLLTAIRWLQREYGLRMEAQLMQR